MLMGLSTYLRGAFVAVNTRQSPLPKTFPIQIRGNKKIRNNSIRPATQKGFLNNIVGKPVRENKDTINECAIHSDGVSV